MYLTYPGKKSETELLAPLPSYEKESIFVSDSPDLLIWGENVKALKYLLYETKTRADLIYIDPPFATGNEFLITKDRANTVSAASGGNAAYSDRLTGAGFIEFLRERLVLLRELLSERGSIYLHTDHKIGHYVKVVMDEIFGRENFRNDVARVKCNPKNFHRKAFGNVKDMLLFYAKDPTWNEPYLPYSDGDEAKLFPKTDPAGRRYTTIPLHAPGETKNGKTSAKFKGMAPPEGRHWRTDVLTLESWDAEGLIEWSGNGNPRKKIYLDEKAGKKVQDVWEYKDPQYPVYPTEKNAAMLDLIVQTSSNPGDTVLDCFCGSGTTLAAAKRNGRRWIGIDQSEEAIKAARKKMDAFSEGLFQTAPDYNLIRFH